VLVRTAANRCSTTDKPSACSQVGYGVKDSDATATEMGFCSLFAVGTDTGLYGSAAEYERNSHD